MKDFLCFIFSDKVAMPYWLGFFLITFFVSWVFFLFGIICFFGLYTISFFSYKKFISNKKVFIKENLYFEQGQVKSIIYHKSIKTSTPLRGGTVDIQVGKKELNLNYYLAKGFIIILLAKKEFGIIKMFYKTIAIVFNDSVNLNSFKISIKYDFSELEANGNDLIIKYDQRSSYEKIILKDMVSLRNFQYNLNKD